MRGGKRRGRGRGRPSGSTLEQAESEVASASPRVNRFCTQCGSCVEPAFRFCPACGERLPSPLREEEKEVPAQATPTPPRRRRRPRSPSASPPASPAQPPVTLAGPSYCPPRKARPGPASPPASPARPPVTIAGPSYRSPRKARPGPAAPLPAEEVLTDQSSRRWKLLRLLEHNGCGLLYEGQSACGTCPQRKRYSIKIDVKDGRIYKEQVFFQRAAKAATVEKWKKWHSVPLLGIPHFVGFGLHADSYRFLVFSDLGRTLQSVLNDGLHLLKEKTAFQIVVRLLDCLEYIHENEYVHGNITAENIYLNPADLTQMTLAGYRHAFRYCPGGKHVARQEGSRTPHEGTVEFISLDSHKGAGPSRRSDLESLGYCLLKWLCGFLPWSDELHEVETVMEKKEKYRRDVNCLLRVCFGQRSVPDALQLYLQHVMALEYEERPPYEALRQLFKKPLEKMKASAYDSLDIKMMP